MAFTFEKTKQSVPAYTSTDIITFSNDAIITDIRIEDELQLDHTELSKITASDGDADDYFGYSVSISNDGNSVIVGAERDDISYTWQGSAYIYKYNSGTDSWDQTKLTASDATDSDFFGQSVAISGDGNSAIVGAPDKDLGTYTAAGAAYIYKYNSETDSWDETKLTASNAAAADNFGKSVSISNDGNSVIVGAYLDNADFVSYPNNLERGSAYIYEYNSGTDSWEETKLTANDAAADDRFGISVAMSGDGNTVIVGAYQNDDDGTDSGSAYIYRYNTYLGSWQQFYKVRASDGAAGDNFGESVAISGDGNTVIVGAKRNDDDGTDSGSAYIYKHAPDPFFYGVNYWEETKLLTASDGAAYDYFGHSVSISNDGNTVIVGAYANDDDGSNSGSAHVFTYNSGTSSWEETKITASDGDASDYFGYSVSISNDGNSVIVGAYRDDISSQGNQGSAYFFGRQKPRIMTGARYEKLTLSQSSALYGSTNSIELFNGSSLKTNLIPIENMVFKQNQTLTLYSTKNVDVNISYIEVN